MHHIMMVEISFLERSYLPKGSLQFDFVRTWTIPVQLTRLDYTQPRFTFNEVSFAPLITSVGN